MRKRKRFPLSPAPTARKRLAEAAARRDEARGLGPYAERYPVRLAEANALPDDELVRSRPA